MDISKLLAKASKKSEEVKTSGKTIKPAVGKNSYIILPGWSAEDRTQFWHDFGQHFVKNAKGELDGNVVLCPNKTHDGQPCAVCDAISDAIRMSQSEDQQKLLEEASSAQQYLLNVLVVGKDGSLNERPQTLQVGKKIFTSFLEIVQEWGEKIFDPANPQTVVITRAGTGMSTEYTVQPGSKTFNVDIEQVLKTAPNLDDFVASQGTDKSEKAIGVIESIVGVSAGNDAKFIGGSSASVLEHNEANKGGGQVLIESDHKDHKDELKNALDSLDDL